MRKLALYLGLSIASTWPLARQLGTHYPRGSEAVATVPWASAWALWWTSDRAAHGFADYWAAPIFYPVRDAFALSEPMPLLGLLATPLLWIGLPLACAYNLVLLASLSANGWFAERLLRGLRASRLASYAGGAWVCLMPVVHHQLGVLTLVPLAGVISSLHYALRSARSPRWQHGIGLGCSFAAAYLSCAQYALLLALAWLPCFRPRRWRSFVVAAGIAALACGPVVYAQRRAIDAHHLVRSAKRVREGAAKPSDYLRAPRAWMPAPPGIKLDRGASTSLFPGLSRLALALAGVVFALRRRHRRRATWSLLAFASVSLLLSLSPRLELAGLSLHGALASIVPGLAQLRSIWRAGVFVQLAITVLAALGFHALQRRPGVWLAAAAVLVEAWPRPQHLSAAPQIDDAWAAFMRRSPGAPYCLLPFEDSPSVRAFEPIARFMVLTTLHGRPMVNGYSSYYPEPHERLWRAKLGCRDADSAATLRALGVSQVVSYSPATDCAWPVLYQGDAVRVYRVP